MQSTRRFRVPKALSIAAMAATLACVLAPLPAGATGTSGTQGAEQTPPSGTVTASLEQCTPAPAQAERSATFMGEMTAIAGTAKMSMRIDVEERDPEELEFHAVPGPGLGVWRSSDPKVKVYRYFRQVTNLSAPASYRGLVRFRWINAKGHVMKRTERLTARCIQPPPPPEKLPGTGSSEPGASSSSSASTGVAPSA
jgi:hypothetical protein